MRINKYGTCDEAQLLDPHSELDSICEGEIRRHHFTQGWKRVRNTWACHAAAGLEFHATQWRKDSRVTKQTLLLLRTIEYVASGKAESVETSCRVSLQAMPFPRPTTQVFPFSTPSASGQRRVRYHTKKIGRPRMKALSKVEPCWVARLLSSSRHVLQVERTANHSPKRVPLLTWFVFETKIAQKAARPGTS